MYKRQTYWMIGKTAIVRYEAIYLNKIIPSLRFAMAVFFNTRCLVFLLALFFASCAQIVSPAGGPKDISPPKVLKSIPENGSVNFKSTTVTVFFDEYIQLRDLNTQLIVSPPIEKMPEVKIKGKALSIEFQEPLKEHTTYTISLGNAIADITEGNAVDNFQYVFSTGDFLDSISLAGKVRYAFDTKAEKGILVMLYDSLTDSVPLKMKPSNFAKTSENGTFRVNNIRNGQYKVFALKDMNANYIYDSPEESIAFMDSAVNLQENDTINLMLFKEESKRQFLKKAFAAQYGKIVFIFNKPPDSLNIKPLNFSPKKEWKIEEYTTNHDTLSYWLLEENMMDTLKLEVSDRNGILDTAEIKLIAKDRQNQPSRRRNSLALTIKTNINKIQAFDPGKDIVLEFSQPIRSLNKNCISLMEDSVLVEDYTVIFDEHTPRKLLIKKGIPDGVTGSALYWKENTNYRLFILPETFTDIFGLSNDTLQLDFKTQSLDYYGNLKLKLIASSDSSGREGLASVPSDTLNEADTSLVRIEGKASKILQLLDEHGNIAKENFFDAGNMLINYEHLLPGKYTLKMIYDTNKNQKWDTGNYLQHIQPEKTIYYSEAITIRSNWDMDLEWHIE